ncbi:hypothetical protein CISIN_1g0446762mg, partial [Citrus sinensis]|jgi:hypothetical protein
VFKT